MSTWREYWRTKVTQSFADPHFAMAPTTTGLKPQNINVDLVGEYVSVVFDPRNPVRIYAFKGQKNRDRFINLYRPFGAKPCGDPLKGSKDNAED